MGAGQSYLYINLQNKDQKCTVNGCTVTPSTALFKDTIDFEVVTYTFNYNGKDSTNFDIYIYDSKEAVYDSSYIFGYCSPTSNQVANKVEVYYSVLCRDKPLVISFDTNSQKYNCIYNDLKYARWNWASYITEHTFKGDVLTELKQQYRRLLLNKTIKLAVGDEVTNDVTVFQQTIDEGKKNYRIVYTPNGKESVLNSSCIFNHENEKIDGSKQLEVKNGCKELTVKENANQIDPYCLTSVKDHFFDGIIVYYHKENGKKFTALYLEFIDLRNNDICLKRKDKDGCWWAEDSIKYNSDTELSSQLEQIKQGLEQKAVTVILDEKRKYHGLEGFESGTNIVCKKYKYKFKEANKPIVIFARKTITISAKGLTDVNAKHVEVYYLNAGGKEDTRPFLIVFDEKGEEGADNKSKKPYHFINTDNFEEWISFEFKNDYFDEPDPPKTEEETKPTKPEIEKPDSPPEELPVWLIVGCVAAGVVLIVTSVVVYGIYWYNTTIKLLT
nr:hypothetical protein MACL_00001027 [Theileria orientalis]